VSDNPHGLLLYDFDGSPCARRVRITLLEKQLDWHREVIDLSRLEQRNPAYLAINPNGFVPTLAHGERVIYESNVITEYLDDAFPERPLYPDDAWQLAQVRMWQSAEAAMAKDYRPLMYQRLMGPLLRLTRSLDDALAAARQSTNDPADLAWEERVWRLQVLTAEEEAEVVDRLTAWLARLETHLAGREYLVGDAFSQAEISVYPRVMMYAVVRLAVTPESHPNVSRWMARLAEHESFANTLSAGDRAMASLAASPVLPFLWQVFKREKPTLGERLRLLVIRRGARRAMRGSRKAAAGDRVIRRPADGRIAPQPRPRRALREATPEERAQPITLYEYRHSPHARRIRWLLIEKGLAWTSVEIDMSRLAHRAPDYLAINPNGELPALRHGERLLYDSQVIAEYLDALYAPVPFYPDGAWAAAQVRMWLALEAGTHKEFRPLFWLAVIRRELQLAGVGAGDIERLVPAGVHPSHVRWLGEVLDGHPRFDSSEELARAIIAKKLDVLEQRLGGRTYLVGERFTMADAAWYTRLDLCPALGIPLPTRRYPNLHDWLARIRERPAAAASLTT
jgi:glutathione S-transferase